MQTSFARPILLALLALGAPLGCADDGSSGTSFSGSGLSSISSAAAPDTDGSSSGGSGSSGDDSAGSTGGSTGGSSGSASATATITTSGGTNPNPDGLPNGSECESPGQCASGNCYVIPLPVGDLPSGVCGICDEDQDCVDAGLGIACSVDVGNYQTACTDGSTGSFCQSDAGCKDGLYCTELIDGVGEFLPMACGTCETDADCAGTARCSPAVDVVSYSGSKYCAELGSVANDGLCPVGGDEICASGHCSLLDLQFLKVGVCGQCSSDNDCPGTCKDAAFDSGFFGSVCE